MIPPKERQIEYQRDLSSKSRPTGSWTRDNMFSLSICKQCSFPEKELASAFHVSRPEQNVVFWYKTSMHGVLLEGFRFIVATNKVFIWKRFFWQFSGLLFYSGKCVLDVSFKNRWFWAEHQESSAYSQSFCPDLSSVTSPTQLWTGLKYDKNSLGA